MPRTPPKTRKKNPPGRPLKPEAEKKLPPVGFRPSRELRGKLEASAAGNEISLSAEIERRLERTYGQDQTAALMTGGAWTDAADVADVLVRVRWVRDALVKSGEDAGEWHRYMSNAPKGFSAAQVAAAIETAIAARMEKIRNWVNVDGPPPEATAHSSNDANMAAAWKRHEKNWLSRIERNRLSA